MSGNALNTIKGCVFDIQRFSVHDGPGIRTVVFLKGCSLNCFWCQNPEGIHLHSEIMFYPDRCIICGRCVNVCPHEAHMVIEGKHKYLHDRCVSCGKCTETCYSGALMLTGKWMTVDEVVKEVLRDKVFYDISKGGVTLSGGDPLVQHEFARVILKRCKAKGLHTSIETAVNCPWSHLEKLLVDTDLIMMDIKHIDPEKHCKVTGFPNKRILENAKHLAQTDKPLIIRVPVIPTVNDTPEEIGAIARFVQSFPNLQYLELLPFHRLGEGKYHALGFEYSASFLEIPTKDKMQKLATEAEKTGIKVHVG